MQKWEYLTIVARKSHEDGKFRPVRVKNEEIKDWEKGPSLLDYMNTMGDEGWELVSEHVDPFSAEWQYARVWAEYDWSKFTSQEGKKYEGLDGYVQYINEMGKVGWELVTTAVQTNPHGFPGPWLLLFKRNSCSSIRLRFKRPKP